MNELSPEAETVLVDILSCFEKWQEEKQKAELGGSAKNEVISNGNNKL